MSTSVKAPRAAPAARDSGGSSKQQVVWALFASAAAGLSTYYYSLTQGTAALTALPASYALCAESGRVYTVDDSRPNVDCVLVDKASIYATGTLGK